MYLDPGGVSLFFQALVATIIAVDFVSKPYQAWLSGDLPLDLRQVQ